MTKLEKIARAMRERAKYRDIERFSNVIQRDRISNWPELARAALEALKEPTEKMKQRGGRECGPIDSRYESSEQCAEFIFIEMIQSVLDEKP